MFCPQCEKEFPWHVMVCPNCDVDTVDKLPGPEPTPDVELVPVLSTGDAGLIALVKSLLERESIEYLIRGEGLQDLFGIGRITEFNYAMGAAEFWVREDDAERARELLNPLTSPDDQA